MSTVVLMLNQDGIGELIKLANDIQSRIDGIMNCGQKPKDRYADAAAPTTFLEAAKEKLPMILEEGDDEGLTVAPSKFSCCRNSLFYLEKKSCARKISSLMHSLKFITFI